MEKGDKKGKEDSSEFQGSRRTYTRAAVECPAIFRLVLPNALKSEVGKRADLFHIPSLPPFVGGLNVYSHDDRTDPKMMEMFLWLDWKVNYLIKIVTHAQDAEVFPFRANIVDLSATGIKFYTDETLNPGALLEFDIILPAIPFKEMLLTGEVKWSRDAESDDLSTEAFEVGMEFTEIKETDRELIIRYVLGRQMQIQREKNND